MLSGWLALATAADEGIGHGLIAAAGLPSPPPPPALAARDPVTGAPRHWMEAERVNLVGAVEQACRTGFGDIAGPLALRLSGFLALRVHHDDWEHTLHIAAGCAPDDDVRLRL